MTSLILKRPTCNPSHLADFIADSDTSHLRLFLYVYRPGNVSPFCGDKAQLNRNCNQGDFGSLLQLTVMFVVMYLAAVSLLDHREE